MSYAEDPCAPDTSIAAGQRFVRECLAKQTYIGVVLGFSDGQGWQRRVGLQSLRGTQVVIAIGPGFARGDA